MVIIKILKRKDASSLVVAFVLAGIIGQALTFSTGNLAGTLSGLNDGQGFGFSPPGGDWKQTYLYPFVWAVLQIVLLEILAIITIAASSALGKSSKRKS